VSFDWLDYLTLAKELAERRDEEAAMRCAVSRAYYAAFHIAANHRATRHAVPTRGGSHQSVWRALQASNVPDWRKAGNALRDLMLFRQEVDYQDQVSNLRWRLGNAINAAAEIVRLLHT